MSTLLLLCALMLSTHQAYSQDTNYADNDALILILGGGIGGLHAAELLQANNITDFIILEGDSVPGGILKTHTIDGLVFETGRPWAHVPAKPALDALGMGYKESDYDSVIVLNDDGEDVTSEFDETYSEYVDTIEKKDQIAEDSIALKRLDVDQRTSLAMSGWCSSTSLQNLLEWYEIDFDYGKPAHQTSTVGPYTQDFGGEAEYYIWGRNGGIFKNVLDTLDENHLRLNKVVQNIDQSGDKVVVTTADGSRYTGLNALVTFSIGVLQSCDVTFNPELPTWKTEQIVRYQMGVIDPIILKFPSKFWGDEEWILHVGKYHGYYPAYLNAEADGLYPAGTNVLIGFVTGDEAFRVERLTDDELEAEVMGVLRNMYGASNVPDPEEIFMERWMSNPLHRGSQASWPVPANAPLDGMQRIQAHVGKVFFANDATTPFIGTVTSQIASSEIAMGKMLGCIRGEECEEYQPMVRGPRPNMEDDVLYGCVKSLKSPGKTRKQQPAPGNIELP